jgi:hypothetical protein
MSNKVIAIVVGVVVVLGGAYYAMKGGSAGDANSIAVGEQNPAMQNGNSSGVESTNPSGKKMSFDAFIKQGGSYMCTVNQNVEGIESKGTVYVNGGNVRGDFKTSVSGMNIDTMFLTKDGYSYSWSSMMPGKGYKAKVTASGGGTGAGTSGQYSFNAEQIGDYNCEVWAVDSSKFAMPSGVVFTEIKN